MFVFNYFVKDKMVASKALVLDSRVTGTSKISDSEATLFVFEKVIENKKCEFINFRYEIRTFGTKLSLKH